MNLSKLKHDADLASEGVWFDFDDAKIKIASNENPRYRRILQQQAATKTRRSVKNDVAVQDALLIDAMARAIVTDLQNFTIDGRPLQNTLEDRKVLLSYPEVRDFVAEKMLDLSNFQKDAEAEETEEVKEPSAGGSSTDKT